MHNNSPQTALAETKSASGRFFTVQPDPIGSYFSMTY